MTSSDSFAEQILPHVIRDAAEKGVSLTEMLHLLVRSVERAYPLPKARFAVAGMGGRLTLMAKQNGCVDAKKAAQAYVGPHPRKKANPETVRKAARERRLISVRDGHGDMLFPVWQFAETGGALPGLPLVLKTHCAIVWSHHRLALAKVPRGEERPLGASITSLVGDIASLFGTKVQVTG